MKKGYREYIYGNYADSLQNNLISGKLEKERKLIYKYFKKNYLPYFPKDTECKILDLGCGLGEYLQAAKRCGYQNVTGVDGSGSVVEFNRKEGIECVQSDAKTYLTDRKEEYDVILFNDVIEHLTKDEVFEILELLRETLKKDGVLFIKTVNLSNPVTGAAGRYLDFTHELGFTEISMRQVLLAASFDRIKIIGADIYVCYLPLTYILKFFEKICNCIWFLLNCLYGRTAVKIFEKNMIAIVWKEQ